MSSERNSQAHTIDLRDESNTPSVKLPYLKLKESLSGINPHDQLLSVHPTTSVRVSASKSVTMKYDDGSHRTNTEERTPDIIAPFEPLNEDGERYLRENLTLPPIEEFTGTTKYYINIASKDTELSSVNSGDEWWNFIDYDEECCVVEKARNYEQEQLDVKTYEDSVSKKRYFPITKKAMMERTYKDQKAQECLRAQIISDLEKRMVSLYSLKKQYKKNVSSKGCEKESLKLAPIVGCDRLTRQRDSMINRIRIKKKENDIKLQKRLDRKLEIVKKVLKEQQRNEADNKYVVSETSKGPKPTHNEYKQVKNSGRDESSEENNEQEYKIDFSDNTVTVQDEETTIRDVLTDNEDCFNPVPKATEPISGETPNVEPVSVTKTSKKSATGKKDKKKKSLAGTDSAGRKKDKGKNKKSAKGSVETGAATCVVEPELPRSQMPDLLLWCEDWRQTQREETRLLEEIESKKLPLETRVQLQPASVTFKGGRAGRVCKRQVTVTNMGEDALRCRVADIVHQPDFNERSPILKAELEGPSKATPGRFWTLTLTLEAVEEVDECVVEVRLQFLRADDVRSQLSVRATVLPPHAEPSMSTSCLRFGSQVFWSTTAVTKLLTISNGGARGCIVHWTKHYESNHRIDPGSDTICDQDEDEDIEVCNIAREVVETCFAEVFAMFRIDARQGCCLLPKSHIVLPVRFLPAMSEEKGDVFCKYTFTFGGEKVTNSAQELVVCGKIEDTAFKLIPDILDMKVCYIGGNIQQAVFYVVSSARHACSVSARVPRALAQQVCVVPKESIAQAHSSICLVLRIVLSWSFLKNPSPYLDPESGLLSFPVSVTVQSVEGPVAPPLELMVMAMVVPPCPLSLTPPRLVLGHVTTQETVCSDLHITNHHHSCAYQFAFLDLPQSVAVEPDGGCGRVLPGETLPLQLLFSPSPQDIGVSCGRPGGAGHVVLSLRCFTAPSLACPVSKQKKPGSSANAFSKHASSTVKLSQLGDSGSGDVAHSTDSVSRHVFGRFSNSPDLESGAFGGGGDFDDEEKFKESQLVDVVRAEGAEQDDSASLKTNDVWDYFSLYQIGSSNGYEILHRTSHKSDGEEGHRETGNVPVRTDSPTVTTISKEEERNSTGDGDGNLLENRLKEEDILLNMDNQNASLVTLSKRNLELFEHGLEEYYPPSDHAMVSLQAHVTDPLVELSSQVVILPPTPCQSYSTANIYIRSKFQKKCKIHERNTRFNTRFEFKCDSKELYVEPRRGCLQYNQSVKLTVIFRPVLNEREIYEKAFEMKMEAMKRAKVHELLDLYYQSKEKKQKKISIIRSVKGSLIRRSKAKSEGTKSEKRAKSKAAPSISKNKKRSKGSIVSTKTKKTKLSASTLKVKKKDSGALPEVVVDPAQVAVTDEDLCEAVVWLLRYLENRTELITLDCMLDTTLDNGERRQESLVCQVVCPVLSPALALCSPPCLQFGPTALGTTSRLTICVTNVSFIDTIVNLSTLNPTGALTCPFALELPYSITGEGVELPPEHTLNIPILFQPVSTGKEMERFEVMSSGTVLRLQAKGEGVIPSFILNPDQEVFSFTHAAKKKADVIISIENTCEAPLRFSFRQEYLKVGYSLPSSTAKSSPPSSPGGGSKKTLQGKPDKKSKIKQEITMLTPELMSCLENDFTDLQTDIVREPWFQIIGYDKNINIQVGEIKQITVRFSPQEDVQYRPESVSTKSSRKKSSLTKSKRDSVKIKGPKKRKSSVESDKKAENSSPITNSKDKKNKKQRSLGSAGNTEKDETAPSMKVIAAKFTVLLAGIKEVKDWIFLGIIRR